MPMISKISFTWLTFVLLRTKKCWWTKRFLVSWVLSFKLQTCPRYAILLCCRNQCKLRITLYFLNCFLHRDRIIIGWFRHSGNLGPWPKTGYVQYVYSNGPHVIQLLIRWPIIVKTVYREKSSNLTHKKHIWVMLQLKIAIFLIYLYIGIVRGGQSLKNCVSLIPVIGHPSFRACNSICLLNLT